MLVHRRVSPCIKFAGTHLYTWVERGTVRVNCPAHEHNTMAPARAQTRTVQCGVECTNHKATALPVKEEGPSKMCRMDLVQEMDVRTDLHVRGAGSIQQNLFLSFLICEAKTSPTSKLFCSLFSLVQFHFSSFGLA